MPRNATNKARHFQQKQYPPLPGLRLPRPESSRWCRPAGVQPNAPAAAIIAPLRGPTGEPLIGGVGRQAMTDTPKPLQSSRRPRRCASQIYDVSTATPGNLIGRGIPPIASLSTPSFARQHWLVAQPVFMPFLLVPDVRCIRGRTTWGTRWLGPDISTKPLHAVLACCARRSARPSRAFCRILPSSR